MPLYSKDYSDPDELFPNDIPPPYYIQTNLNVLQNYYTSKLPYPVHEAVNHQTHGLHHPREAGQLVPQDLPLHQAPCDLTHQQDLCHLPPLQPHTTEPTLQLYLDSSRSKQQVSSDTKL